MGGVVVRNGLLVQPLRDSAVASVIWKAEKLDRILMVRWSDGCLSTLEIPQEIRASLRVFDRDAVERNAMILRLTVLWALPDMEFDLGGSGLRSLRHGVTPAEFGSVRHFAPQVYGVDIGEFDLPCRRAHQH